MSKHFGVLALLALATGGVALPASNIKCGVTVVCGDPIPPDHTAAAEPIGPSSTEWR